MPDDNIIYSILTYFSLVASPAFLFGAIKYSRSGVQRGTPVMIIGFSILTLVAILQAAKYCEIFTIRYHPYLDGPDAHYFNVAWQSWEKWYYYSEIGARHLGAALVGIGFYVHGRALIRSIRPDHHHS